jgi:glycosyltransferase involved in cell wall biosynthesis
MPIDHRPSSPAASGQTETKVSAFEDAFSGGRRKKISILTPCYNEEAGIAECYERVRAVLEKQLPQYDHEHLFIDNCSQDRTVEILKGIAARDKRVKIIVNSRNFGHSRSPFYGMMQTTGDAVVGVVADLQTPPELIPNFVAKWEAGYKIVIAVKKGTREGPALRLARKAFYELIARLSNVEQIKNFMGFGLYDRSVMEILRQLNEPDPYFRGLVSEVGFERAIIEYAQPQRKHGKSRNNIFYLVEYALLALTTYSRVPLRFMTFAGVGIAALSLLVGIGYLIAKIVFWNTFSAGIAPILIATLFFAAIQLMALGLIGEYVGLLLQYARRFPLVIEKERVNFEE